MVSSDEKFEDRLAVTEEDEKANQLIEDDTKASEIIFGSQEVYIDTVGTLVFEWPDVELSLEGDRLAAQFKTRCMRDGSLFSIEQLRAIYRQPIKIKVDGAEVIVGDGQWTDEEEYKLEHMPDIIRDLTTEFSDYRSEIQELKSETEISEKEQEQLNLLMNEAQATFNEIQEMRLKHTELMAKQVRLFSESIEHQALFEKVKLYAPLCVKKKTEDGLAPLWKDQKEFLSGNGVSLKILGLFSLFMRGADVSFFGDTPEGQM